MSPVQPQPLPELVGALADELERQGVPCSTHASFPPPRRGLVYLFVSPRDYARAHGSSLPERAVLKRTVALGALDPRTLDDVDLDPLRDMGGVFDISQGAVAALHRRGIPARLLRPGYVAAWDRFEPTVPRPIDIVFYGTRSARRESALAAGADVLARHGCVIHVADDAPHPGDSATWMAAARWPILAQAKLVISLHRGTGTRLEWLRVIDALHAGAVFVTEHAADLAPFVPGEHLLVGSPEALPFVAEALLGDERRLAQIRDAAHQRLSSWLPFSASVAVMRAALLEVVGRPVAAGAFLGVARDRSGQAEEPMASPDPSVEVLRAELRETRSEIRRVRREVETLHAALGAKDGEARERTPRVVHRTGAWSARRAARVSVMLVVGGDAQAALATLDSVAASREREFELIVVVPRRGLAADRLARWFVTHPRLATVAVTAPGRGPAEARNVALDFARAPACLVLEAGERLAPRCLGELLAALENGDPAVGFVYPIQSEGVRLRSAEGFDASRPDDALQIFTPALIRTALLRDLGGYRDEAALTGTEDDDLWRRLAALGHPGVIVPQILAAAPA
jgi:hypothetical protein